MTPLRLRLVVGAVAGATVLGLAGCSEPVGTAAATGGSSPVCAAMSVPVRYQVNPATQAGLLSTSPGVAAAAAQAGYTTDEGTVFAVAARAGRGLVAVHQLRRDAGDQLWTTDADEARKAVQDAGYADEGVVAYVSVAPLPCTVDVRRFRLHGVHRFASTSQQQQALGAAGWIDEGAFFAARVAGAPPAPSAGSSSPSPSGGTGPTAGPTERPSETASPTPPPGTGPRTVVDADFDAEPTGPVTPRSFVAAVGRATRNPSDYDSMRYVPRSDGPGQVVRTHLAAHTFIDHNEVHGDGNVIVVALPDQQEDTGCVSYDVRFAPGFEVSAGGKLPGLLGVAPGVSPGTPTGGGSTEHGWSGRVMWLGPKLSKAVRESGQADLAVTYLYHPGQVGTFGDDISWGRGLTDGAWHTVRQCYTLNTIGAADGALQAWVDGAPVLQRTDLVYRTDPAVHITHLDWSIFRGGDNAGWAASTGGDIDLDDLQVVVG